MTEMRLRLFFRTCFSGFGVHDYDIPRLIYFIGVQIVTLLCFWYDNNRALEYAHQVVEEMKRSGDGQETNVLQPTGGSPMVGERQFEYPE